MKLHRSLNPRFTPILFIPVADVAAALIFFFLLSGTFLLQPGISVDVPRSPFVLSPQRNPRVVSITSAPAPAIYFENSRLTAAELASRLANRSEDTTLIIKSDRSAPVELVVEVSNVAIAAGCTVVLATAEPNPPPE